MRVALSSDVVLWPRVWSCLAGLVCPKCGLVLVTFSMRCRIVSGLRLWCGIMLWRGVAWHGIRYGMVWYGWYGMVWYGMVWYGMVWYGMVGRL